MPPEFILKEGIIVPSLSGLCLGKWESRLCLGQCQVPAAFGKFSLVLAWVFLDD